MKKLSDSSFVKLDSFIVNSGDKINFSVLLDQPEMLFIDLKLNEGSDIKTLNFFAEKSKSRITFFKRAIVICFLPLKLLLEPMVVSYDSFHEI